MHYEADIQLRENHVRVHVTGRRRTGDAAFEAGQVGRHIVEFCRKADVFRVLVILDLSGRLSAIDSYEIVSQAGAGGMGEVYKANDPRLNRMVAIKVLPEGMADQIR